MKTYPKVRSIFRNNNTHLKQWMTNIKNLVAIHNQYIKTYDTYQSLINHQSRTTPQCQSSSSTINELTLSNITPPPPITTSSFQFIPEEESECEQNHDEIHQWFQKLKRETSRYLHPDKRYLFCERFPGQTPPTHEWYTELLSCFHDKDYCSILVLFGDHIDWIQPEPPDKMNDVLIHLMVQISNISVEMMMEISKQSASHLLSHPEPYKYHETPPHDPDLHPQPSPSHNDPPVK